MRVVVDECVVLRLGDAVRCGHVAAHQFAHDRVDGCVARLHLQLYAYYAVAYLCKDGDSLQIDVTFGVRRQNVVVVREQRSGQVDHEPTVFPARMHIRSQTRPT